MTYAVIPPNEWLIYLCDERTYDIFRSVFSYDSSTRPPPSATPPPVGADGEDLASSRTPRMCTRHARMYTYQWLIESKGRGRYKVCRPPRHETHALPLERRRRRTSSCSNVHLVSVDTPTLSARNDDGPRQEGDVGTTIVPAAAQGNIEGVLYCASSWTATRG